jgi:CheY-like chemotaxis protein
VGLLFQRFSQLDSSTTKRHGGTGLGLAICKGLVEAMGGQIGVDTAAGKGSAFWLEIPAPLVIESHAQPLPPDLADIEVRQRVLVVDDNEANLQLVAAALRPLNVEVATATSGEDGIAMAALAPYDFVLMDIRMPGMGGIAAMKSMRTAHADQGAIVAFTAEGDRANLDSLMKSGFDGAVAKPLNVEDLRACVAKFARKRTSIQEAENQRVA